MAAGNTYEAIATNTLASNTASVTFSSIPSTYTDLVLVCNLGGSTDGEAVTCRLNSDSGSNYSYIAVRGNGTSASSERATTQTQARISVGAGVSVNAYEMVVTTQFNNYSNSTTHKTFMSRANRASNGTEASLALWRNTSAITTILVFLTGGNLVSGSTFTLYGIKAA